MSGIRHLSAASGRHRGVAAPVDEATQRSAASAVFGSRPVVGSGAEVTCGVCAPAWSISRVDAPMVASVRTATLVKVTQASRREPGWESTDLDTVGSCSLWAPDDPAQRHRGGAGYRPMR